MFAIGTIIDNKYQITASIGMGGFGNVVKAKQMAFDRTVAIKFLNPDSELDEVILRRFEQEAKILSGLKHRNLSLFYGYGFFEDAPYMVMEFVEGRSVETLVDQRGSLPIERSLNIAVQICDALTCVHTNDVIHRDLKPSNVMLVPSEAEGETVKLIDFGLSKTFRQPKVEMQRLTEAGSTVGTVEYMSPEQCMGHRLDGRADVYSVGCILYKCLAGRPPFMGEHTVVVMQQHLCDPPPPLAELVPKKQFPDGLQEILNKALAKNLDERYQSAEEMAEDLRSLLQGKAPVVAHQITLSGTLRHNPYATQKNDKRTGVLIAGVVVAAMVAVVKLMNVPLPNFLPTAQTVAQKPPKHFDLPSNQYYASAMLDIEHYKRDMLDNLVKPVTQDAFSDPVATARIKANFENAVEANEYDHLLGPLKVSRAYGNLAQIAFTAGHYLRAGEYAEKAFDSAGPMFIRDVGGPINILTSSALMTHQYDSAITTLHKLESELNRQHYKQSNSYVTTEICLADLYLAKGDVSQSKRLNLALDNVVVDTATFCVKQETYRQMRSRIDEQRQRIQQFCAGRS